MSCDPIYAGTTVRIGAEFEDLDGNPADPTTVVFTVEDPTGADDNPVVNGGAGAGQYWSSYMPALPGLYRYRLEGSGAIVAVMEGEFYARESGLS